MADDKRNPRTLEEQLAELGAQISELMRKLENAAEKEAEALRPKLKAAQERLHELKQTSAEAWEDLKKALHFVYD